MQQNVKPDVYGNEKPGEKKMRRAKRGKVKRKAAQPQSVFST